jgi:hypothetical protein
MRKVLSLQKLVMNSSGWYTQNTFRNSDILIIILSVARTFGVKAPTGEDLKILLVVSYRQEVVFLQVKNNFSAVYKSTGFQTFK